MEKMNKLIKKTLTTLYLITLFALWCVAMSYMFNVIVFKQ